MSGIRGLFTRDIGPGEPKTSPSVAGAVALPTVGDDEAYGKLEFGAHFKDPTGTVRQKPWTVTDDKSFEAVPEGMPFRDPEGKTRRKPTFEAIGVGPQILYDMAVTDTEKQNILGNFYGKEAVKKSPQGDVYVQAGDKMLKPGRGWPAVAGFVASEAAPVAGSIAGEIGGAAAGSVLPGPGTVAGAIGGGAAGAAAGTAFNDMVLGLAGVYDRSAGQEAGNLALSGAFGGAGTAVGRGLAAIAPSLAGGWDALKNVLPGKAAYVLGAAPEETAQAVRLSQAGALVRPSAWAKEAPYLKKVVEEFDPVFREQEVLKQSAQQYYEKEAGRLLDSVGVAGGREPLTGATKPVSSERAGEAVLKRVHNDMAVQDAKLDASLQGLTRSAETAGFGRAAAVESQLSIATAAADDSLKAAQKGIDIGFSELRGDVNTALKAANADRHPGDLWRRAGEKLDFVHAGIDARAAKMYSSAYQVAGETPLTHQVVEQEARQLIETLPLEFQSSFPTMVHQLDRFRGNEPLTLEWAHHLRSLARQRVDRLMPYADRAEGINRKISGMVNRMLHDPAQSAEVKAGVKILDATDGFYSKNMGKFEQNAVDQIVKKMRTGNFEDAPALAKIAFDPDSTVGRDTVRKLLGPELWKAVHGADVQGLLKSSTNTLGEIDAGRFAQQVAGRVRQGVWDAADLPAKTTRLANQVLASEGKIPLHALPGDNVTTLLQRAADYAEEAKVLAKEKPLETLEAELKQIASDHRREVAGARTARRNAPLGFLTLPDASVRVMESADRIIGNPDLMIAAATKFGAASPEFESLRQVAAHRLLQRNSVEGTGKLIGELQTDVPESVQRLLFPGLAKDEMVTLAKDMAFLLGGTGETFGGGMAAASRVLHPTMSALPLVPQSMQFKVPVLDPVVRFMQAKYYQLMTWGVTHPAFIQWVASGLKGPPASRAASKAAVQQAMGLGGAAGAGIGAAVPGASHEAQRQQPPSRQQQDWRHLGGPPQKRSWQNQPSHNDIMRRAAGGSP